MIIGKQVNERYNVISKIAEGGMANIFLAKDIVFEKDVVLKVLKSEYNEEKYIEQFKHEVESLAELSHENIINVFDYCEVENMHFIVMEYLDGITLKDLIRKKRIISPQMTVDIISKVASALKHAHSFNLIHRDIKPQNIMIQKDATIKLMDFGISKHSNEIKEYDSKDNSNSVMGSVHYISPEQVRGDKIDIRSDIYALGIVMYEMLVGKVPYNGRNAVDIALMHLKQHIGNITDINPLVPQSLSNVVIRTTSPDINLRHQDIQSFEYDLTTCLMPNRLNEKILSFIDTSKEDALSKTQLIDINNEKIRNEINKNNEKTVSNDKKIKEDLDWKKVAIIGGLITFLCIALLFIYGSSNKKLMPNLNGKTYEEAQSIMKEQLDVVINSTNVNYVENKKSEEKQIWKQYPKSGSKIDSYTSSSDFIFTINDITKEKFKLKNYTGMLIEDAREELEKRRIKVIAKYVEDSDVIKKNQIISQSIKANKIVNPKQKITFKVSKHNAMVKLPSLSNLKEKELKEFAKRKDINILNLSVNNKKNCYIEKYINVKENNNFDVNKTLKYKTNCNKKKSIFDYIGSFFGFNTDKNDNNLEFENETNKSRNEAKKIINNLETHKSVAKRKIWDSDISWFIKVKATTEISFSNSLEDIDKILKEVLK